jgi:DNA polymerase-1
MTLVLIDGHAIAYRSYFAFINRPLTNSKGQNTSAVFGFIRMLMLVRKKHRPDLLAAVFDSEEETQRHREYPDYKANREEMPDDLSAQLPILFDVLDAFGVPVLAEPGYEADDIIATLAEDASSSGIDVRIVTSDKDLFQLLSPNIRIIRPSKGTAFADEIGPDYVKQKYGLKPRQITDLLALMGDSSDNIPGVKGIGEKTALKLLHKFGSLDTILENVDGVEPAHVRRKIADGRGDALFSRELVRLKTVPLDISLSDLKPRQADDDRLADLLIDLEFHQILRELSLRQRGPRRAERYETVGRDGLRALRCHAGRSRRDLVQHGGGARMVRAGGGRSASGRRVVFGFECE